MSLQISCSMDTFVLAPGDIASALLHVRDTQGAVSGLRIPLSLPGTAARLDSAAVQTNNEGDARLDVVGVSEGKATITARADRAKWRGDVTVTDVEITLPQNLNMKRTEEDLLRVLFWDKREVQVVREFGGGMSGNRVLQVRAFDDAGGYLTQGVKIGIRDEIRHGGEDYKHFQERMARAARRNEAAAVRGTAAIVYGDATATTP